MSSKQGFASITPEEHKEVSSRGGKKSGIIKGFATLTPTLRKLNASNASRERWRRVKEERQNDSGNVSTT